MEATKQQRLSVRNLALVSLKLNELVLNWFFDPENIHNMTLKCELSVEVWAPISTLMQFSRHATDSRISPFCCITFQTDMYNPVHKLEAYFGAWAVRLEHQNRRKKERHPSAHLSQHGQRLHLDYLYDSIVTYHLRNLKHSCFYLFNTLHVLYKITSVTVSVTSEQTLRAAALAHESGLPKPAIQCMFMRRLTHAHTTCIWDATFPTQQPIGYHHRILTDLASIKISIKLPMLIYKHQDQK